MDWLVKRANNVDVEREHLNKILQEIRSSITSLENLTGTGGGNNGSNIDHGALLGLSDDDHTQYLNTVRAYSWLQGVIQATSGVDPEFGSPSQSLRLYILTSVGTAAEALTAGAFVNINEDGEVVLADASVNNLIADGFVLEAYADGATNVRVYYGAENTELTGLLEGHRYYLSADTPGAVTKVAPGNDSPIIVQQLGVANSASSLLVNIQQPIERP